ncbi:MAG: hypothetical protein ACUVRR_02410 [Candidatus Fervidibacter sp.]|uniref:hypothetical protein n=1 Tax=Candidatus Fervidibacter sp. TaxID=3100871 RepID=UPI00404A266D
MSHGGLTFANTLVTSALVMAAAFATAQPPKDETKDETKCCSYVRAIVFKDGFVYTFYEGTVTPQNGQVLLRTIPQAREGTLYAYLLDSKRAVKRLEFR